MRNLPLVSVIIPCFNAERWVREAVQSCLDQTYGNVEVIVVDDGSIDQSLEILHSFGSKIKVEAGPNQGGNHARNRGFALSSGAYVQFLDADDYLLPQKLEHQVHFLTETGADVVYGDWRHRHHLPDGSDYLQDVAVSGEQTDVLESLLSGWWVSPACLLFTRQTVVGSGGWDEKLAAAQDKDFFISVALSGADIRYQPGCESIYRRYGNVTVSTSHHQRWLDNNRVVLEKAESALRASDRLNVEYRGALAAGFFTLARGYYDSDRAQHRELLRKALALNPALRPQETKLYNITQRICGFTVAEKLAGMKRQMKRR